MIIPKCIADRYLEIEEELATLDEASDQAATLRLERAELDSLVGQECPYCGTQHRLGECSYFEAESRR